jgi:muramidase (phage lysozyme)
MREPWLQKRCKSKQHLDITSLQLERPYSRAVTTTNAGKDMVTQEPYKLLVGKQISTTTMESSIKILQRAKERTAR